MIRTTIGQKSGFLGILILDMYESIAMATIQTGPRCEKAFSTFMTLGSPCFVLFMIRLSLGAMMT